MDLRRLRYFVAVAEELHFGRAARRLNLSQPPLSQQIQLLEGELGVSLFSREGRQVTLTAAGLALLPQARATLAQAQAAAAAAQRAGRGESGQLAIGFTGSVPLNPAMMALLSDYRERYPQLRLQLREDSTHAQLERLRRGVLDVGIFRDPLPELLGELESEVLRDEALLAVLPVAHPLAACRQLSLAQLAGQPLVFYGRSVSAGLHDRLEALCIRAGFRPAVSQEVYEMWTAVGLVAAGFGVALVAPSLQGLGANKVVFRPFDDPAVSSALTMAWPPRSAQAAPALHNFLQLARHHFAAPKAGGGPVPVRV